MNVLGVVHPAPGPRFSELDPTFQFIAGAAEPWINSQPLFQWRFLLEARFYF